MEHQRKSVPRFRRTDDVPNIVLSDDDYDILRHVYRHRLMESTAIYKLFPNRSAQVISRRLKLLFRTQYLDRPISQNIKNRLKPGTDPYVYAINKNGAAALRTKFGTDVSPTGWRYKNSQLTAASIEHHLETSRFVSGLAAAMLHHEGTRLLYADQLIPRNVAKKRPPGLFNTLRADIDHWPVVGKREGTAPDAIVSVERGETGHVFFIEIDRGTETIEPGKRQRESEKFWRNTSYLRKFLIYSAAFKARAHETQLGLPPFRVLTVTTQPNRVEEMQLCFAAHLSEGRARVNPGLFLFTDWHTLNQSKDYLNASYVNAVNKRIELI